MAIQHLTDTQLHELGNSLALRYRQTRDPRYDRSLMAVFHEMTRREQAGEVPLAF